MKWLLPEAVSGSGDEPRRRAVEISLASGIICPFTSYVGVRTSQKATWHQGKERHWWKELVGQLHRSSTRCFSSMCLIQPLSLFALKGPLALLPPRQSLTRCQILELRGSWSGTSCYLRTVWVPPGWLTAVQQTRLALRRLTDSITTLPWQGAGSKGMGQSNILWEGYAAMSCPWRGKRWILPLTCPLVTLKSETPSVNMRPSSGTPSNGTGMVLDKMLGISQGRSWDVAEQGCLEKRQWSKLRMS